MYKNSRGFSLTELITVMALASIMIGIVASNLREFHNAAQSSTFQLASLYKRARADAISKTSAVRVRAVTPTQIITETANRCSDSVWTADPNGTLNLSQGAVMSSSTWSVCFNSRGFCDQNVSFSIDDGDQTSSIEVLLGGGVAID